LQGNDAMGMGLRGMRERILQLGGNLSAELDDGGTTIAVTFPIAKAAGASNNELAVA
jgi:signal transduction histidine kinase